MHPPPPEEVLRILAEPGTAWSTGKKDLVFNWYATHRTDRLVRKACAITGNLDDARDATQQGFLNAYRSIATWKPKDPLDPHFQAWLQRIVLREAARIRRRWRPEEDVDVVDPSEEPSGEGIDIDCFLHCYRSLPQIYREVFDLRLKQGLSYKEIETQLGIREGTARERYSKSKRKLLACLRRCGGIPS